VGAKYNSCYCWENIIVNNAPIWRDSFQEISLTKESIFVHTVIINYDKKIIEDNWAYYPNVKSLLGFIQYVYIPTAFFTWLDNEVEEFAVPLASQGEILEHINNFNKEENNHNIFAMNESINKLNSLWDMDDSQCMNELKDFVNELNTQWRERDGKLLNLTIFKDSIEVGEYIIPEEDDEIFIEVLEEDIGLTKEQWKEVYMNVYDNEFIRKKFIDILNYKIGSLI
jgi:hypothetical protein